MVEILEFAFMQNAIIAGVLVSIICGVIGSLVVVNKMTFIAGGVAHGAYGGIGIALFLGLSPLFGASAFALLLALIIAKITLKQNERIDSILGALWAFGMAIGIIFIDLTPGYNVDMMSYLFGSILSVPMYDIYFISTVLTLSIVTISLFYKEFQAMSFDREFALLRGVNVKLLYFVLVILISLCVVATIRVVGLILVIALLTIPTYIAESFCCKLSSMMFISSIIAIIFTLIGLFVSVAYDLTSGASIILIASIAFFINIFFRSKRD